MRITNRDASNLDRFGCTVAPKQNLICIRWPHELHCANSANVVVRLIHTQSPSGPLLSLAFEISCTRALPLYCFFPFDLRRETHANFLSNIFHKGRIQLRFLADSGEIKRTHELTDRQCEKMNDLYAKACADAEKFAADVYDFDRAVVAFEQGPRIVDYFQYVITDLELQRVMCINQENAAKATPEDRAEAASIANELLEVFSSQHKGFAREFIEKIPTIIRSLLFCLDLHKQFEDDYDGFADFLVNVIAGHAPKEDNQNLRASIPLLDSMLRLMDHLTEDPDKDKKARDAEFREIMSRITAQGWSFEMLRSIASVLGFQGGRPGRPVKDYSVEYELRAVGKKWREVAEHNFNNDPEIQQEFGGRNFANLSPHQRMILMHRVKEGVRGFAKRTDKPFPPEVQKNSR